MSAISSTSFVSTDLSALSTHAHGHKKGVHGTSKTDATDATGDGGDGSAGSTQSLFSSLLHSAEKIIGVGASVLASRVPGGTAALGALTGASSTSAAATAVATSTTHGALGSQVNTTA